MESDIYVIFPYLTPFREQKGGERRKRWKEVGGSTGPRPPAQSRHALRTREPAPPRVRDQESQVDPGQGAMGMGFAKSSACWTKGKNAGPRAEGILGADLVSPNLRRFQLGAASGAPGSHQSETGPRFTAPPILCSPVGLPPRDPLSRRRNKGSDRRLCGPSPDFTNWRLELVDSGEETGAEGVEREARARSRTWQGVKGSGRKSA